MRKLIAIGLFSIVGLGFTQGKASAWWEKLSCCHKCCLTLQCRQYNAFSPFCCDGACGFMPIAQGPGCGYGNGSCYAGDGACLGELPATNAPAGKTVTNIPPSYAPLPSGPSGLTADATQAMPGIPPQGYPVQNYPQNYPPQNYRAPNYQAYPIPGYGQGYPTGIPTYNPNIGNYYNGGQR
jgi:hypothetical protein